MTSTITLDQIVNAVTTEFPNAAPQAQGAGIAAAIIAINDASKVARKPAPAKPKAVKAADKSADFWSGPASNGQIARFNRLETALNAHDGENHALSVKGDFTNAKDCSEQYAELAKLGKSLGLNWAA
jgi:hypothetical protein